MVEPGTLRVTHITTLRLAPCILIACVIVSIVIHAFTSVLPAAANAVAAASIPISIQPPAASPKDTHAPQGDTPLSKRAFCSLLPAQSTQQIHAKQRTPNSSPPLSTSVRTQKSKRRRSDLLCRVVQTRHAVPCRVTPTCMSSSRLVPLDAARLHNPKP